MTGAGDRRAMRQARAMKLDNISFETVDWQSVTPVPHPGEHGTGRGRTRSSGEIRVGMVEYTAGYTADHWCGKGHLLLCVRGELHTELENGRTVVLREGMGYYVADATLPHRS